MIKLLIIFTATLFQICFCCNDYYDPIKSTLIIPANEYCNLHDLQLGPDYTIKIVQIYGILNVIDVQSFHLKYIRLTINSSGKLLIGKHSPISQNLIIFEQLPSEFECNSFTGSGSISVNSDAIFKLKLKEYPNIGVDVIEVSERIPSLLSQKIKIVNPFNYPQSEQHRVIETKEDENKIILDSLLSQTREDYDLQNENLLNKFILIEPTELRAGVIFRNSCLSANVEEMRGVLFEYPQSLVLSGTVLKNNQFIGSDVSKSENSFFEISMKDIQDNIFIDLISNFQIQLTEDCNFLNNIFIHVNTKIISEVSHVFANTFISSEIILESTQDKKQSIFYLQIFSTTIYLIKNNENKLTLTLESFYLYQSTILLDQPIIDSLLLESSTLINSAIKLLNREVKHVSFKSCYFYCFKLRNKRMIFNQKKENPLTNLDIVDSQFIGYCVNYLTIMGQEDEQESQQQELKINIKNVTLNIFDASNFSQKLFLFLIANQRVDINYNHHGKSAKLLNRNDFNLIGQSVQWLIDRFQSNNEFIVTRSFYSYQFETVTCHLTPCQDKTMEAHIHEVLYFVLPQRKRNLMFTHKIHYLYLRNANTNRSCLSRFIVNINYHSVDQVNQIDLDSQYSKYAIIIRCPYYRLATANVVDTVNSENPLIYDKRVIVNRLSDDQQIEGVLQNEGIIFNTPENIDELQIIWNGNFKRNQGYDIEIRYCSREEMITQELECKEIDNNQANLYQVTNGYYISQEAIHKCPFGCKICFNLQSLVTCSECFSAFFDLTNGICSYKCLLSQGEQLIENMCNYNNSADKSQSGYISFQEQQYTLECLHSQYSFNNQCYPCHFTCMSCSGPTKHHCLQCIDQYIYQYGYCVR